MIVSFRGSEISNRPLKVSPSYGGCTLIILAPLIII